MGVKDYIAQYMFNVPPSISPAMDLAKMLAKIEMIEGLQDRNFTVYRQARAGLASLPQTHSGQRPVGGIGLSCNGNSPTYLSCCRLL